MLSSLVSSLSLITGPALLTNASTVMLLGATNRYGLAINVLSDVGERPCDHDKAMVPFMRRRTRLLSKAMLWLQLAVGSFGLSTLSALAELCFGQTVAPGIDTLITPLLLGCSTIGGVGLILGVSTLFVESWSSDSDLLVLLPRANRAGYRPDD
ncbi:hypothetical protein [Cupriavidus pampae]|uniref:MotA/TolQ/ExbB proton channel domain-containing protein n=1 Tax=Cupriavidus pampae TaxID=659251 RepID=A0ABM8WAP7_9BURK|nr:hypothetical protein [Cupriavidus pampae]CAG9164336.1 hypothetical protein LMG32289_00679 [Cupriavidus pampae]